VHNDGTSPSHVGTINITTNIHAELIRADEKGNVWRITENDVAKTTKDAFVRPGALNNNRTFVEVTDDYGNLVATGMENPGRGHYFGEFPTYPVHVGDSWRGYHVTDGARYTDIYRLDSLWKTGDTLLAKIDGQLGMNGGYARGYSVISLSTNQQVEGYQDATFRNWQGVRIDEQTHSELIRVGTQR
jgi:hypothetical protein